MPSAKRKDKRDDPTAALISKFEDRVEAPEDLKVEMDRWEGMRQYVHTDAMELDEEDAVGTNFIYRNQQAGLALILPEEPKARLMHRDIMLPDATQDPEGGGAGYQLTRHLARYARTHELMLDYQQGQMGLEGIIAGAVQDAMTVPYAIVKLRVQEDHARDPLGYGHMNDQTDMLVRYRRLAADKKAKVFDKYSAQERELQELHKSVREYILEEAQLELRRSRKLVETDDGLAQLDENGDPVYSVDEDVADRVRRLIESPESLIDESDIPEVAHYRGFVAQQVMPEDFRFDWNIQRPEDFRFCRWMAHREWMTPADVRERWPSIKNEDLHKAHQYDFEGNKLNLSAGGPGNDPEYGGKDDEERYMGSETLVDDAPMKGDLLAVWEYWDRVQGKVFRWVQGMRMFLEAPFMPEVAPSCFFPFELLTLGRATGRFWAPSDTDLQQPLQDESNRMRSWQREAQRSAAQRFIVGKGLLRPNEKQNLETALPNSVVEVERADDFRNSIHEVAPVVYNPALYDRSGTLLEMQQMAGIPAAALGAGNMGMTATSDSISNQQMGNQVGRRRKAVRQLYLRIYTKMAEMNAQLFEEQDVQQIVGPGAVWPPLDRQQILANFIVDIDAVLNDADERAQELQAWVQFSQITQQMGLPVDGIASAKYLLRKMGIREDLSNFISVQQLVGNMGAGPAGPDGQTANPGATPEGQAAFGANGGAPAGEGLSGPPAPASIPGPA